jgi:two-component system, chemotaxis family, sensor kinase CheA
LAIDREKYRRMFIEEARESLRSFNNDLVSLEKLLADPATSSSPEVVARAREVMDAAFRTAHSLKGMGAAMGYVRFAELAHRLEDLADLARQGLAIGPEGFDLLLEGSDALEEMVEKVAEGHEDPDAGDLPGRVHGAVELWKGRAGAEAPPSPAPPSAAAAPPPAGGAPASRGPRAPQLVVKVKIADDASLPQVRAFVVHKALSALPGWKETEPPPESLRTRELPGRLLTVRFDAAEADAEVIGRVARDQQAVADVTIQREEPAALEEPAPPSQPERPSEDDRTVRVRTALLDEFIDSVGELLLARSRMRALAGRLDLPELADLVDEVERLTRDLHGRVVAARMTPLGFLAERFPRVVRDLARNDKKSIDFSMHGTEIELDRAILDELQAPFLHMIRNAVDHGHEGDEVRRASGKPAAMRLALRASRERDTVLLELEDDGRGMDPARLRQRAVERGLLSAEAAAALTDAQALELICLPGFSTAEQVSHTSGRGVGMDVVKATLERLGGTLRLSSTPGQGSRVVLQLPLTVAIIQVLVVEAGDPGAGAGPGGGGGGRDAYAIPVARVEQAVDLDPAAVSVAHGRAWMKRGADLVPLFDLSRELGYAVSGLPRGGTVILVGRGASAAALRVDAILGQEEVVAKPLGAPLSSFGYLSGATLLADGRAAFILEPLRLVAALGSTSAGAQG